MGNVVTPARLIITTLIVAVCALILARVAVLQAISSKLLPVTGVEDASVSIRSIGIDTIILDSFSGCYPAAETPVCANGGKTVIRLSSWNAVELIDIERLELCYEPAGKKTGPVSVRALAKQLSFESFPQWLHTLRIRSGSMASVPGFEISRLQITCDTACSAALAGARTDSTVQFSLNARESEAGEFSARLQVTDGAAELATISANRDLQEEQLEWNASVYLAASEQLYRMVIAERANAGDVSLPDMSGSAALNAVLRLSVSDTPHQITIRSDELAVASYRFSDGLLEGTLSDALEFHASGRVTIGAMEQPVSVTSLTWSPQDGLAASMEGEGSIQNMPRAVKDIGSGRARVAFKTGRALLRYSMKLPAGSEKGLEGDVHFYIREGAGSLAGFPFSGATLHGDLSHSAEKLTVRETKAQTQTLNTGVSFEDVSLRLKSLTWDYSGQPAVPDIRAQLSSASADVFGGRVSVDKTAVNTADGEMAMTLTLTDLSLQQLVELHGGSAVRASGSLSGSLPLRYRFGKGVFVESGWIEAGREGGYIRVGESLLERLSSTPGMETAARALRNYEYTRLASTVSYRPQGTLLLEVELEGKSPALNTTRPVHVKLDLEQNVLNLIRSLQIVSEVESEIRKSGQK